jgi:hypothetical protein
MLEIVANIKRETFTSKEVSTLLDVHFHPEITKKGTFCLEVDNKFYVGEETIEYWSKAFYKSFPSNPDRALNYISDNTNQYWYQNQVGQVCQRYVWPKYFEIFPRGKILLASLSHEWLAKIWRGQTTRATDIEYNRNRSIASTPQEMSGILSDSLPLNILLLGATGIYPLFLYDSVLTSGKLIIIYLPDRVLTHSQMLQPGVYQDILWKLHHVYNDQWTLDGFRGPKSVTPSENVVPTGNVGFLNWIIKSTKTRMEELLSVDDPIERESLAMTYSRAAFDCILSVMSQLPYLSRSMFFSCLDKLANLGMQIGIGEDETTLWKSFIGLDFLTTELEPFAKTIPDSAGQELHTTVCAVIDIIKITGITPDLLRDMRNTHHGYKLKKGSIERLFAHSGEVDNDITLLATPLCFYFLAKSWVSKGG